MRWVFRPAPDAVCGCRHQLLPAAHPPSCSEGHSPGALQECADSRCPAPAPCRWQPSQLPARLWQGQQCQCKCPSARHCSHRCILRQAVLCTDPSSSAAGNGTSHILCEINLLRSLVVWFLQGGKLSSQSLSTYFLAFLWLLEHTACSKEEEAWPVLRCCSRLLLVSFCQPLACFQLLNLSAVHCWGEISTLPWQNSRLYRFCCHERQDL